MNCRPLYPQLSRPARPYYRERTGAYLLLADLCRSGKLKPKRLPIYKKIVDLTADGKAHFVSNRAISKFTFEDFGLLRCDNTIANAKKDLVKARLLNLVRGKNKKVSRRQIRRPANEIQCSGSLARRLGWRVGFLPGVILQRSPYSTTVPSSVINFLEVLRETKPRKKLSKIIVGRTARGRVILGGQNKAKRLNTKIMGKEPPPFWGLSQKAEETDAITARLRDKWLPNLPRSGKLGPEIEQPPGEKKPEKQQKRVKKCQILKNTVGKIIQRVKADQKT